MIFQYDGVNISSLWRLTKLWSTVEMTMQSAEIEGFSMALLEVHQVTYKNVHQRSPNAGHQYLQDHHNGFVYKVHYILDALGYFIFDHDVSVDSKHIKSIKINPTL